MSQGRSPRGPTRPDPRPPGPERTADPGAPRGRGRRSRRRLSRYRVPLPRARIVAAVVVGFLLSGVGGAASFFWPTITAAVGATGHTIQVATPTPIPGTPSAALTPSPTVSAGSEAPFTVLLLGSDNDGKFTTAGATSGFCCTQSMILVRVDPAAGTVTMLSFPRDLYVPTYSASGRFEEDEKISEAFGFNGGGTSGIDAEISTVEHDFQVQVDHYVWIGLQGLINLIDEVGGIDIVASHPVMDDDYPYDVAGSTNPFAADRVAVLPGAQHMDGVEALEYVRSRHDDLSEDLGRTVRQQQVLVALRQKLSQLSVGNINNIAAALSGQVLTDVSLTQFPLLLGLAKDIGAGSIQHVFLTQFSGATVNGEDVEEPDMSAILSVVHQYFPAT
ncbi:MAG: LCP family protein [Candidatus Dormibacteria bacterium]